MSDAARDLALAKALAREMYESLEACRDDEEVIALLGKGFYTFAAEQTAALREENARLRGALKLEHENTLATSLSDHKRDYAASKGCEVCSLLADPEG